MLRVNDAVKINIDAHLAYRWASVFCEDALFRATNRYKAHLSFCCSFVVYFFMFRLFKASWYLLALALCSLRDFAKLCVPEKSSFAHMYM